MLSDIELKVSPSLIGALLLAILSGSHSFLDCFYHLDCVLDEIGPGSRLSPTSSQFIGDRHFLPYNTSYGAI